MSGVSTFKFLVEEGGKLTGDIRRVTMQAPVGLASLRSAACDILGWEAVSLHFNDEDGDHVTVASQHELDTAVALSKGKAVRLVVCRGAVETPAKAVPPPKVSVDASPAVSLGTTIPASSVCLLDSAPNATIPEHVMVQFSAIAEFFQRMAQQMAEFAPRIPVIVNEGIRRMSADMDANFRPLDTAVAAARDAPVDLSSPAAGEYKLVVHRLPASVVHPGVECAHCHKKPITGMRYKCVQCDSDLCQDCIVLPDVHVPQHFFVPICAPAVGSHFATSAKAKCDSAKAHVEPVVRGVCHAMGEAVEVARAKGAEIGEKVKQQIHPSPVLPPLVPEGKKEEEKPPAPAPAATKPVTETVTVPSENLKKEEADMLLRIGEMGFTDKAVVLPLIRKHKDLTRVVQELIR